MSWLDALILGLVEGVTEFLPISSTGHLILTQSLLGLHGPAITRALIIIQGAAILAVCWEFRVRLWQVARSIFTEPSARRFALNLAIAFVIFAIPAKLFKDRIEDVLFAPIPVAIALVVGGIVILWAERRKHVERIVTVDQVRPFDAVKVGLCQLLALFPGTSRSAATIVGGLLIGMSRKAATEFSFFIAIPLLLAATAYELWVGRHEMSWAESGPLALSSAVSFVAALISIRFLLRFVGRHSFAVFAWYRIAFGGIVLAMGALGWVKW
ncbi:MAG TPA: undecaprenyl-diphosphate phosphatase [Steroidobacteraceae bacterium]|nr:undecaprenyl-diphosphate phosphatase [Steroidobacteraceae bacterium]